METPLVHAPPARLSASRIGIIAALGVAALAITTIVGFVVSIDTQWGVPDRLRLPAIAESFLGLSMLAFIPGLTLLLALVFTRRRAIGTALGSLMILAGVFLGFSIVMAATSIGGEMYFGVVTAGDVFSTGGLLAIPILAGIAVILIAREE